MCVCVCVCVNGFGLIAESGGSSGCEVPSLCGLQNVSKVGQGVGSAFVLLRANHPAELWLHCSGLSGLPAQITRLPAGRDNDINLFIKTSEGVL